VNKKETIILLIFGTLILAFYIIAGFFSHPAADDFSYATLGQKDDFFLTVLNERYRWNGRYLSNFLLMFSPLNWGGILAYKFMPLLLICFIFFGTLYFFKNILDEKHIVLSLISTSITFGIMPDITEGIYWYSGAWTYIPGAVIFLIGLSLLIKFHENFKFYHYLILSFIFIIASGFNEIISLLGIVTFSICLLKKRAPKFVAFLILFFGIFIYILLAPGNLIRGDFFPNKSQLFFSVYKSLLYSLRFIGEWLLNPALFLWGVILLKMNFKKNRITKLSFLKSPFFIFMILFIPTYICCFGPLWSTGGLGQYRTANLASYLFLPFFTLSIIANKDFILQKLKFISRFKHTFIIFIFFLLIWKNHFFLFTELLNGRISQYNQEMYNRYDRIKECKELECYIPEISNKSKTLFVHSLDNDPNHWLNKSYQLYFNSGQIIKTKPITE
tara:strand:- start:4524 stop:5855 length:1332 start_codon:yes stop_codon:yes gene_type:complete